MPEFEYTFIDDSGKTSFASVMAESQTAALSILQNQNIQIFGDREAQQE